jgi:hypothetical protein
MKGGSRENQNLRFAWHWGTRTLFIRTNFDSSHTCLMVILRLVHCSSIPSCALENGPKKQKMLRAFMDGIRITGFLSPVVTSRPCTPGVLIIEPKIDFSKVCFELAVSAVSNRCSLLAVCFPVVRWQKSSYSEIVVVRFCRFPPS